MVKDVELSLREVFKLVVLPQTAGLGRLIMPERKWTRSNSVQQNREARLRIPALKLNHSFSVAASQVPLHSPPSELEWAFAMLGALPY